MTMTRDTIGKISQDLLVKEDGTYTAHELQQVMQEEYEKNIQECIVRCEKMFPPGLDFYIVVATKREKLLTNVIRNYFFGRQSCPTPEYDQTVYCYKATGDLNFMWVIPSKEACRYIMDHWLDLPPDQHELRDFVRAFEDGSLLRLSKKLNKEQEHSNIIQK